VRCTSFSRNIPVPGGFKVNIVLEGLGEIPEIQSIYLCHLKEAIEHPLEDALTKKSKSILNSL